MILYNIFLTFNTFFITLSILFVFNRFYITYLSCQNQAPMKKLLTLLLLCISVAGLSQPITVDANTYTVPQLVNNILINSPCISTQNISWRTGSNFGSVNGIGYFVNTNPNFPMQSGIVLSTGSAVEAAGPNTVFLNSGNVAWTGDSDLEAILAASGITMNSTNATVLEFEFSALSPYFDFDFLFASEEYGNFQCQFSDAFAFLLTDLTTGTTQNLAVVPNTNTPISVVTIRDFLYNSGCPSVNAQYFGRFNGGNNAASAPINYNGQTTVLNAAATLVPGRNYRIKLVIADRGDFNSDSAIFIASNSFNIGQDVLGPNRTVASGTAVCQGGSTVLTSGLSPAQYTFQWRRNGVVIPGQTGPSLTVTQPGTYALTYTNIAFPCQEVTDEITVEFHANFVFPNPVNLYKCNTGNSPYTYNLNYNTGQVTNGIAPGHTVAYFATQADAQNNVNPIGPSYVSAGNETVFVRVTSPVTGCGMVKSFQLLLTAPPVANTPNDVQLCARPDGNPVNFNIRQAVSSQVLGGQNPNIYGVAVYRTLTDATNNTNIVANGVIGSLGGTCYVRVFVFTDPTCYAIVPVNMVVLPIPPVDDFEDVITCDDYTLPALTNGQYFTEANGQGTQLFPGDVIDQNATIYIFNSNPTPPLCPNQTFFTITILRPDESIPDEEHCNSYTLPALVRGNYHTAPNGGGTLLPGGSIITTSQTIYYYYMMTEPPFCQIDMPFNVTIIPFGDVPTMENVYDCTSYTLPPLSFGAYYTEPGGQGTLLAPGTVLTSTQTVFIYATNGTCTSQSSFQVVIGMNFPTSVNECVSFTLPALEAGNYYTGPMGTGTQIPAGTVINTTQTIYVYAVTQNQPNCTDNYNFTVSISLPPLNPPQNAVGCGSYELPQLPYGNYFTGPGGTGDIMFAGDLVTTSRTMYIYLDGEGGCINDVSFPVTINPFPEVDSRSDIDACHAYVLTNLEHGNYFTGPNGTGTQLQGGDVIQTTQTLYIYAESNGCTSQTSFTINIFTIDAHELNDVTVCDAYVLPALPGNNKYFTQTGGQHGSGQELAPGTAITTSQTIYIYVESGERINCSNESSFVVTVNQTPVIPAIPSVFVCESYTLPTLTVGNYYTQPNKGGDLVAAGTVITTNQTLYVYAETGTTPNCFAETSFSITIYNVPQLNNVVSCSSYVLPALTTGNYFNGPNGTGGQIAVGSVVTQSQTIYVFGQSGYTPNCTDETSFTVTVVPAPTAQAVPVAQRTFCDTDGTNDGVLSLDLTQFNTTVLGNQSGPEFVVTYHATLTDAQSNTAPLTQSSAAIVYVRVSNTLAPDCFAVRALQFIINKLPEPTPQDGIICYNTSTNQLIQSYTLNSGLSASTHTIRWYNEAGDQVGTGAMYTVLAPGVYSVIATNNATGCASEEVMVTVTPSEPAIVTYTVSEDFADSQTLTVNAQGSGEYEYQLNNGEFQDSPIFYNVMSGFHTLTVRDKNGCGLTVSQIVVVNYPHFFTPNGDGANETWNIRDLRDQEVAYIYIYDRYGKVLTKIKPSGSGWDGTYNNALMPSDDYWFSITYQKDGQEKEFRAHFALKR
ncbi:gliding motility-associated C-terminal domain-containing protein [Flavobacterium fontis]|uniref:Gliding motility-associated C-terminal domain-containing protein n=2 Tax=Flavobacterium fontis TaxID=1124188 RepID=A0A1M5C4C5_9FLAO|nr:gliding motility-associated C-terminal domain-containing protein [Flavobacterium fontis]